MPILSPENKKNILDNATKVYEAYLAFDFFKYYSFSTTNNTLLSECQDLLAQSEKSKEITVNDKSYTLSLCKKESKYQITLSPNNANDETYAKKRYDDYQETEILNLLSRQKLELEICDEELHLSNFIQNNIKLGGAGKIEIYRSHLSTLYNIIEKLESEEEQTNLLVALATGSGKIFVQAL